MYVNEEVLNLLNLKHFHTDIDGQFLNNFIDLHLPIDERTLRCIEAFCRRQEFVSEVLLALYTHIIRRLAEHMGASPYEHTSVVTFLAANEHVLTNGTWQARLALYELLTDMESVEIRHPFTLDLEAIVFDALVDERTNIAVRSSAEKLAILRLTNLLRRSASAYNHSHFDYSQTYHHADLSNNGAAGYFLWRFVDALAHADYAPVMDSLAGVLANFVPCLLAANGVAARLLQKAKGTRRIGIRFARFIAMICASPDFGVDLLGVEGGFCDSHSKIIVLYEMFEYNRNTRKFYESELVDVIVGSAGNRLNFIAPLLANIEFVSKEEQIAFLRRLSSSLRSSRLCSEQSVQRFIRFLADVDADEFAVWPEAVDCLYERILQTPQLLVYFTRLDSPSFDDVLRRTNLGARLSEFLTEKLTAPVLTHDDADWEECDSALEIFGHCAARQAALKCDFVCLTKCAFRLAIESRNTFVRLTARRVLLNIFGPDGDNETTSAILRLDADEKRTLDALRVDERAECEERVRSALVHKRRRAGPALSVDVDDVVAMLNNGCALGDGIDDCISKECY